MDDQEKLKHLGIHAKALIELHMEGAADRDRVVDRLIDKYWSLYADELSGEKAHS